jgi:hypothetical protein
MKKNFIKSLLFALIVLSVVSCKEDERKGYLGDEDFVRFLQASGVVDEIGAEFPVVIAFTKKDGNKSATVSFEVTSVSAIEGVDYTLRYNGTGNTINFDAGKYTDTIWVKPLENDIACGPNREFKIKITSVDGAFAGFPKTGGSAEFTMGIKEVVAFDINSFLADEYLCNEFGLDGTPYVGNPITVNVTISSVGDNTFAVENFGDYGSIGGITAYLTFNPDVANQTITILETPNGIDPFYVGPFTLWSGSGTYDVCSGKFTVTYALKNPSTGALANAAVNVFEPK